MKFKNLVLIAAFALALLLPPEAQAHSDHDHRDENASQALQVESVRALQAYLDGITASRILGATESELDAVRATVGKELMAIVSEEVLQELREQATPPMRQKIKARVSAFLNSFNPITIGKWVMEAAKRHGAKVAIAIAASEVTEQSLLVYAAKHPELAKVLIPLYLTHAGDAAAMALMIKGPKFARLAALWTRFGFKGPFEYHRYLFLQRHMLPIDWSEVIHADTLDRDFFNRSYYGNYPSHPEEPIRFLILTKSRLERFLPRWVRIVFTPKRQALRDTLPTVSVNELERILKDFGFDPALFKVFKKEPRLYAAVLLNEIMSRPYRKARLESILVAREYSQPIWMEQHGVKVGDVLASKTQNEFAAFEELPDVLAQRLIYYFKFARDLILESALSSQKKLSTRQKQLFAQIDRQLESPFRGLGRVATTPFIQNWNLKQSELDTAWAKIWESMHEANGALLLLKEETPLASETLESLSSALVRASTPGSYGLQGCVSLLSR